MAGTRKRSSTGRKPTAGKRKTAQRKIQHTRRQKKATGDKHRVAGERSGPAKRRPKTVRSSSRKRADEAGESNALKARKAAARKRPAIDVNAPGEPYGVILSEREREGESIPTVPAKKTRATQSTRAKKVPKTGIAKKRSR